MYPPQQIPALYILWFFDKNNLKSAAATALLIFALFVATRAIWAIAAATFIFIFYCAFDGKKQNNRNRNRN